MTVRELIAELLDHDMYDEILIEVSIKEDKDKNNDIVRLWSNGGFVYIQGKYDTAYAD